MNNTRILILGFLALLGGCAARKPAWTSQPHFSPEHPVIIVPGILGSRLRNPSTGKMVWGKAFDLAAHGFHLNANSKQVDGLELPTANLDFRSNRDQLEPYGVLDRFTVIPHVLSVKVYEKMLKNFRACGYQPGSLKTCHADENAFVFYYDWRRDLVESAALLGERIAAIRASRDNPQLKVDLVAHSMGCLVVKYYLLYGNRDLPNQDSLPQPDYSGAEAVNQVVMIAPPFDGSAMALKYLHEGYRVGLQHISAETLFTMPSIYQLLPRNLMFQGNSAPINLYQSTTWVDQGIGMFAPRNWESFLLECQQLFPRDWKNRSDQIRTQNLRFLDQALTRAQAFHRACDVSGMPVPTLLITSPSEQTLARPTRTVKSGQTRFRFDQGEWSHGDRTVTQHSSQYGFGRHMQRWSHAGRHDQLPSIPAVMDKVARYLSSKPNQ